MKLIATAVVIIFCFVFFYCCVEATKPENMPSPDYVGTAKCQSCHAKEYAAYKTSDHFHAMDSALPRSVKGDFNNSYFVYLGDTSFFYTKDNLYYVRTKDSTGKKEEFQVSFTFGWQPLQQYLVRFPDGRIQALPFCWDTRPKEQGGQHWFHIYGKEKIPPGDELFWTGINQNWNNMCADCHTTNYFKNFDVSNNSFHSTWSEQKVSCESCHGPASNHIAWTEKKYPDDSLKGFVINLAGEKINWKFNAEKGIAYPDKVVHNTTLIETCARCHARASRLSDFYYHGQSFLQSHIPSTINDVNYYIDGQIKEEDYEYGSFLQSKMYAQGVTCINCHDAHTMQVKQPVNTVCFTCHAPEKFDVQEHTHHAVASTGSQCVSCHMPVTTYMMIDARRDHSIRIPRPDLSVKLNTPNACNKCHTDKTVNWAAKYFIQWYGDKLPADKTYGQLMYAVSKNTVESLHDLNQLLTQNYPDIIKATALEQYTAFYSPELNDEIKKFLQSPDPDLRLNAVKACAGYPADILLPAITPLLDDGVLAVRTEAMNTLAPLYAQLDENKKQRFNVVMNEYLGIQKYISDRPEGFLNQGILLAETGKTDEAEQMYLMGLKRFPGFIGYYGNLADLYRAKNNEMKSKEFLDKGLAIAPNNGTLHYALGLWYVRNHNETSGISELKKAATLEPSNASFVYGYSIGLFSKKEAQKAIQLLEVYLTKYGNDPMILNGLISIYQDQKQADKAAYYADIRKNVFGY
jgi:tetratricopeptide (TPR) repeat protein